MLSSTPTADPAVPPGEVPATPVRLDSRHCDRVLVVDRPIGLLGRARGATYRLRDSTISRVHAQLEYLNGHLVVSDLESSSGTAVEGVRVDVPTEVRPGQELRFGRMCFVVNGADVDVDLTDAAAPARLPRPVETVHNPLTPRQTQVLRGMADGLTNAQIAERLGLAPRTVKAYAAEIFDRLGRRSRAGAVAIGHRLGLLDDLAG